MEAELIEWPNWRSNTFWQSSESAGEENPTISELEIDITKYKPNQANLRSGVCRSAEFGDQDEGAAPISPKGKYGGRAETSRCE